MVSTIFPVKRALNAHEGFVADMKINFRRFRITVSKQCLNVMPFYALFHQMGCKAMAQTVRGCCLRKFYSDGEDSFALLDQLRDATGEESWISDMMFRDTVRALTPRERRIIALRYLNGKTQTQVAKEIGISQAQVSRLEKAALNHIKEQICNN